MQPCFCATSKTVISEHRHEHHHTVDQPTTKTVKEARGSFRSTNLERQRLAEVIVRLVEQPIPRRMRERTKPWPDGVVRSAKHPYEQIDLVLFVLSREQRFVQEQLAENAAHCPNIDGNPVQGVAKKYLWRPIPERDDARGQVTSHGTSNLLGSYSSRHPKIRNLEDTSAAEKEV